MSDGGQTGMCELHGPIYEAGYCRVCASMSSIERVRQLEALRIVPPVMQRASSGAQFNVVGDELRKLTNHIIRLEAQLTALRADADKGRETSEKEAQGRYERMLTLISVLQDSTFKRLEGIETCQEKHRLALESIVRILEKVTGAAPKKRQQKRVRKVTKR